MLNKHGFTIFELIIVITVIGIIAAIGTVSYGAYGRRTAVSATTSDLKAGTSSIELYESFNNNYPPNLAGTKFAPSQHVAMTLYTNAEQRPVYENLSPAQDAQLFVNSCNGEMPYELTGTGNKEYNSCSFSGINIQINGTGSTNFVIQAHGNNGTISKNDIVSEFNGRCGSDCEMILANMLDNFEAQGGNYDFQVPNGQVDLPEPTLVSFGSSSKYCLEATSVTHPDVRFHTTNQSTSARIGTCPDAYITAHSLHYP